MRKYINLKADLALGLIVVFLFNSLGFIPMAQAQEFTLPKPGMMIPLSSAFNPPILKGIKVYPDNPFRFEFILDKGDSRNVSSPNVLIGDLQQEQLKTESIKLIKYFLASLTIPEKDLWVNLSPYEKNRIVPELFGKTEMGRDLLAEDYMLKQITASLMYPEGEIGKKFWKRIYQESAKKFGTTNIPVNTFNKVWIVPDKAVVYENAKAGTVYVVEAKLKVMLEEDYLSLEKHGPILSSSVKEGVGGSLNNVNAFSSQIIKEIIIPELTREVNQGQNFAQLRQVYNSLILAQWYKKKIKDSVLGQVYEDKNKVYGILSSPKVSVGDPEHIYQRYLQSFKKGAYNYIKEELDPITQQKIPRKYFSGGADLAMMAHEFSIQDDPRLLPIGDSTMVRMEVLLNADHAMVSPVPENVEALLNKEFEIGSDTIGKGNLLARFIDEGIYTGEHVYRLEVRMRVGDRMFPVGSINGIRFLGKNRLSMEWVMTFNYPLIWDDLKKNARHYRGNLMDLVKGLRLNNGDVEDLAYRILYGQFQEDIKKDFSKNEMLHNETIRRVVKAELEQNQHLMPGLEIREDDIDSEIRSRVAQLKSILINAQINDFFEHAPEPSKLMKEGVVFKMMRIFSEKIVPTGATIETMVAHEGSLAQIQRGVPIAKIDIVKFMKFNGFSLVKVLDSSGSMPSLLYQKDAAMNAVGSSQLDVTWRQLEKEGYSYEMTVVYENAFAKYVHVSLFYQGRQIPDTRIFYEIRKDFKIVYTQAFFPNFPIPSSDVEKLGRGRAFSRELYRALGVGGYYIIAKGSESALKSFRKRTELNPVVEENLYAVNGRYQHFVDGMLDQLPPGLNQYETLKHLLLSANVWGKIPEDAAMTIANIDDRRESVKNGGIDFTSDKAMAIQNNGQAIKFHIGSSQFHELENASGFSPVIINIQPLGNLRNFLEIP